MKPVIVKMSDPALARRLGAVEVKPGRREIVAIKSSDAIIFAAGKHTLLWGMHKEIVRERTLMDGVKRFVAGIKQAGTNPAQKR